MNPRSTTESLLSISGRTTTYVEHDRRSVFDKITPSNSSFLGSVQILFNTAVGSATLLIPYCYTSGIIISLQISLLFCFMGFSSLSFFVLSSKYTSTYDYNGLFSSTFGRKSVWICHIMIFLVQFGSCCIYCNMIGSLVLSLPWLKDRDDILGKHYFWIFIISAVFIFPVVSLKSMKALQHVSSFSSICVLIMLAHSIYWLFRGKFKIANDIEIYIAPGNSLITSLSVNCLSYNCHMNLFPTLEHMKKSTYDRSILLILLVMCLCFIFYNTFGIVTYISLGNKINPDEILLKSYDTRNIFTLITVFALIFILIISVPIVIWSARTSLNDMLFNSEFTTTRWITIAFILTLGSAGLASLSQRLTLFFNIVGGLFCPFLIFFLPSVFFIKNQVGEPKSYVFTAYFVCIIAVISTGFCTYLNVRDIIFSLKK